MTAKAVDRRPNRHTPACLVHPLSPRKPNRVCRPFDGAMR